MDDIDIQELFSLRNEYRSLRYDLRNTEILLESLGNPHRRFRSVLIAGTNGKGSVACWLASMLPQAALYTSPHLERLNERISIGGIEISNRDLSTVLQRVQQAASDAAQRLLHPPTFFERVTAAAFCYFSERVQHAVLEVGLGGRLDATSVVAQDVSVITHLSLDHQEHLGTTLEQIALEKAGIIKESESVVLGRGAALECVLARAPGRSIDAREVTTQVRSLGDGYFSVDAETPVRAYPNLQPQFPGRHQIENLKVALRAAECLEAAGWPLDGDRIALGINRARWPGRLERFSLEPSFLIDGGHNPAAAAAIADFLAEFHPEKVWLIFGGMKDKDLASMLRILTPHSRRLILTQPSDPRAEEPASLATGFPVAMMASSIEDAIGYVREVAAPTDTVLVTGSLHLAGEARAALRRLDSRPMERPVTQEHGTLKPTS